jgi:hypothetical protein
VRYGKQKVKQETRSNQRQPQCDPHKNIADRLRYILHYADPLHAVVTAPILVTTFTGIIHSARQQEAALYFAVMIGTMIPPKGMYAR